MRDKLVSEDEFGRARELMKGRLLLRMEDTRVVSDWLGGQELLTGVVRTVDEVTAQIDAVTRQDIRSIARRLFVAEQLNLAVVGPYRSPRRFQKLLRL